MTTQYWQALLTVLESGLNRAGLTDTKMVKFGTTKFQFTRQSTKQHSNTDTRIRFPNILIGLMLALVNPAIPVLAVDHLAGIACRAFYHGM